MLLTLGRLESWLALRSWLLMSGCLALPILAGCGASGGFGACANLSAADCQLTQAMALPSPLPQARGNKYGDSLDAAKLGFQLFFDSDLGSGVACVTCHAPDAAFADHLSVSTGKAAGVRNAPTVFNAARLSVFFWDGRADSLWSQPLFAIENPLEMASSRAALAQLMANDAALRPTYESVFGGLPDTSAWPASGKPGDAAFDALPAATQNDINRVAANVGKALEAYMRQNAAGASAFDAYINGDAPLIEAARLGLKAFIDGGCADCHSGPMLSDQRFHDVGIPSLPGAAPDSGRAGGVAALQNNVFNLAGPYADPGTGAVPPDLTSAPDGAFRTPPLRNVARTAPYGHDGAVATLDDVMKLHAPNATDEERGNLIAFLQTLNGAIPPLPWSNWPSPQ